MTLLETRKKYHITQVETASFLEMPLRTYIRYEQDNKYGNNLKREMMMVRLHDKYEITEEKGLLNVAFIKSELVNLFASQYQGKVDFCYLFGSYAKGYATEKSDVDLCISTSLTGFDFVGISEHIRKILFKKIDLVRFDTLKDNLELINEIMKDGIKIYG